MRTDTLMEGAIANVREAAEYCLEGLRATGDPLPREESGVGIAGVNAS